MSLTGPTSDNTLYRRQEGVVGPRRLLGCRQVYGAHDVLSTASSYLRLEATPTTHARRRRFSIIFGGYSAQMLLVPDFLWAQNMKNAADKYHIWMTRISGLGWLSLIYTANKMGAEEFFPIALGVTLACTIVGPVIAETTLECNTAHGAVYGAASPLVGAARVLSVVIVRRYILFPLLLGVHALAAF